jgi:hypothetical protein
MQNLAPVASQGGPFLAPAPASRMARGSSNLADGSKPAVGVANIQGLQRAAAPAIGAVDVAGAKGAALQITRTGCRGNDVGRRDDRVPG